MSCWPAYIFNKCNTNTNQNNFLKMHQLFILIRISYRFFVRNLEHRFMKINCIHERKHRIEVAVELGNSFDFWQNLGVHCWITLLYELVFPCQRSHLLVSGLTYFKKQHLWDFWDFTPLISIFVGVAMTPFFCVLGRELDWGSEVQSQVASPLLRYFEKTTLLPLCCWVRMIRMVLGVMVAQFFHLLSEGFLLWLNSFWWTPLVGLCLGTLWSLTS